MYLLVVGIMDILELLRKEHVAVDWGAFFYVKASAKSGEILGDDMIGFIEDNLRSCRRPYHNPLHNVTLNYSFFLSSTSSPSDTLSLPFAMGCWAPFLPSRIHGLSTRSLQ